MRFIDIYMWPVVCATLAVVSAFQDGWVGIVIWSILTVAMSAASVDKVIKERKQAEAYGRLLIARLEEEASGRLPVQMQRPDWQKKGVEPVETPTDG